MSRLMLFILGATGFYIKFLPACPQQPDRPEQNLCCNRNKRINLQSFFSFSSIWKFGKNKFI
jgi:hypothetical protein